jgi:methyl-accepting chemotaxis protein
MAAMLVVSLPMMVVLAVLLTTKASSSLTDAAQRKGISVARAVALRVEDWLSERRESLTVVAQTAATGRLNATQTVAELAKIDKTYADYSLLEITDLTGKVTATSWPGASVATAGQSWFPTAAAGHSVVTSPVLRDGRIQWILAEPIRGAGGRVQGVAVANLDPVVLAELLNPELDEGDAVVAVDSQHRLIYDTAMGKVADDAALLAAGSLSTTIDNAATRRASTSTSTEPGTTRFTDSAGRHLIGGYDLVDDLKWVLIAQQPASVVLAPVTSQRNRAILVVSLAAVIAIAAALAFGIREGRKLRGLADETSNAGLEVNSAAAELSASSDELAATTTQQSASVTQTTAATEELARASASIAETVDEVARQTAETRDSLEQAEADVTLSGERTLALRINDIDRLLELINDIADQTNLLALNAAIEAARAGENGLGFAVVADEVRRLAERSKVSAAEIADIVAAVQGETNATVMAMETGAKQMHQGLALLAAVTDANDQVRLTTQQQRSATVQVVETMEQLTDSSRQVSATAQQIAAAAGSLADLAGNLETAAAAAKERY